MGQTDFSKERMEGASPDGGWKCPDEVLAQQKTHIRKFVKGMGSSLLDGKDMISTSFPVEIFEPRSYLQRLSDPFAYGAHFLRLAASCTDPTERLKYVMAYSISGLHTTTDQQKPFNPILGETYQGHFVVPHDDEVGFGRSGICADISESLTPPADRVELHCEQTSHHPPVSRWMLVGPNGAYKHYGGGEWKANFRGSLKGRQHGVQTVEFSDGTKIMFEAPIVKISGLVWGERRVEYEGTIVFEDEKNELGATVTFDAFASGILGSWFRKKEVKPTDYFNGSIYKQTVSNQDKAFFKDSRYTKGDVITDKVYGTWMGFLEIDGKKIWDHADHLHPADLVSHDSPLPFDSRIRSDLIALKEKDIPGAKKQKALLERIQRQDRKLRKRGAELRKAGKSVAEIIALVAEENKGLDRDGLPEGTVVEEEEEEVVGAGDDESIPKI